jgi:hypothetical protein
MEAVFSSETLVLIYQITRYKIPENNSLHDQFHDKLKGHEKEFVTKHTGFEFLTAVAMKSSIS